MTAQTDTLSDLLQVIRFTGGMFFRARLRAPYSVKVIDVQRIADTYAPEATQVLPFHLLTRGSMWVDISGHDSVECHPNDIIVLPHGNDHVLTHAPGTTPVELDTLRDSIRGDPPRLVHGGDGEICEGMCGFFYSRSRLFNPLLEALPEVLLIREDPERTPWLIANLRRTYDESSEMRPGSVALVQRLTELLFIDVVQRYIEDSEAAGWLRGLTDPVVSCALQLIHDDPAHAWTVAELGRRCGASRSVLAARFQTTVGLSPIRYLTGWRMEHAAQRLVDSHAPITEIAAAVGYESEAAFNQAFKRHVGEPPGRWRRSQVSVPTSA